MALFRAILLRFLYGAISLIFISFVTFVADALKPGDPAVIIAGEKATPQALANIRHEYGLDQPWPVRYVHFVEGAVHFDFGRSYYGSQEPIGPIIARNLPMTIKTAMLAIVCASGLGLLFGTIAAIWENRFADRAMLSISTLGVTVPNFVLAPILMLIFSLQLGWLPLTWESPLRASQWYYLVLPVVCLAARPMASLTRLTRASMIDTLQQEFIRTATAKGVPPLSLYVRHALRNAILPVVTAIGTNFGYLLTGSFVIERAFLLPGIGRETIEAIQQGNTPVIQACILLTGAIFITVNLIVDLMLPLLDPRIREGQV